MIVVLQRIQSSDIKVEEKTVAKCGRGLILFVGVADTDTEKDAVLLANKILKLRVFCDDDGKMNLSVKDIKGEILAVPNFTLLGSYKKGNRPNYMRAAEPVKASRIFDYFCECLTQSIITKRGVFGADMKLNVQLDGPVTLCLDSNILKS